VCCGFASVEEPPSPKSQLYVVALVEEFVKVTVQGAFPPAPVKVKLATGPKSETVITTEASSVFF
jgi:hypothetical protein